MRRVGSDLRCVCLVIGGGEGESSRISEVTVFATTLECDGDNVKRMSCVDDSGPRPESAFLNKIYFRLINLYKLQYNAVSDLR